MVKEINNINWNEIMIKFEKHNGSISDFCKENNIKQYQLYHQRKKLRKNKVQTFHAIDVSKVAEVEKTKAGQQPIKIEIGNAKIYIPVDDKNTFLSLVRELAKPC